MVKFVLLSSDDDTHVLACEIFVGAFKRVNWHLDFDFCPSACDVCSLELKKQKIWSTKETRRRKKEGLEKHKIWSTKKKKHERKKLSRNRRLFGDDSHKLPRVCFCFLLQKKRVKRDFVEDITMPDSLINEVQKIHLQYYPESST